MIKLSDLSPLTASDIQVGGEYIAVCSAMDHSLSVSRIQVLSPWDKNGKFQHKVTYGEPEDEHSYEPSGGGYMESFGVPIKPREWPDNYHRLFEYTPELYEFFRQFVKDQQQIEWLTFMGVKEPERAIAAGRKQLAAFLRTCEIVEEMDVLEGIEFMLEDLDSQRIR